MKFNFINAFCALTLVLIYLPDWISRLRKSHPQLVLRSRRWETIRRVGVLGSAVFMILPVAFSSQGLALEFGFSSLLYFGVWAAVTIILVLTCWIFWILYTGLIKVRWIRFMLYLLPACLMVFSGVMLRAPLLGIFSLLQLVPLFFLRPAGPKTPV